MKSLSSQKEGEFSQDIRRTIILSRYMECWGMPSSRVISRKDDEEIEVYYFPSSNKLEIHRFATVGISGSKQADNSFASHEFMFALPPCLGNAAIEEVNSFLLDISVYSLYKLKANVHEGTIISETTLAPKVWKPKAILVDTPRAEPEQLASHQVGNGTVTLYWLVPIYGEEYELIHTNGLQAFDEICKAEELSLADVNRPSFVK